MEEQQEHEHQNDGDITYYGTGRWAAFKRVLTVIFPFLNVGLAVLIIYLAMSSDEVGIYDMVGVDINWWWIGVAAVLPYVVLLGDAFMMQITMKTTIGRGDFMLCTKGYIMNRFYMALTPFMIGGHPYHVYYKHRSGMKMGEVTATIVPNYIMRRIGYQVLAVLILLVTIPYMSQLGGGVVVGTAIVMSLVFNFALSIFMVFAAFGRFVPRVATTASIYLLWKTRFIKDRKKVQNETNETLWEYRVAVRKMSRRPALMVALIMFYMLIYFTHLGIILPIYAALWGWDWSVVLILILGVFLTESMVSMMPLPGGTGPMELFFISIYGVLFGTPQVLVALIFWKIFTYIVPILNGIPVLLYDSFVKFRGRGNTDY
ncbi:MAG: flippase-like domain-containing protein [Firmicutes bacterium]|nr:flippase-like domain-containing protein [Bacillota bacterium]